MCLGGNSPLSREINGQKNSNLARLAGKGGIHGGVLECLERGDIAMRLYKKVSPEGHGFSYRGLETRFAPGEPKLAVTS